MTSKVFRSIAIAAFAAGAAFAVPGTASAQAADNAASLSGIWNMSLVSDHVIPVALVLEQSGTALKGTFTLMGKDFPLTGDVAGGKVTLTGKGPAFGRPGGDHNAAVAATGGGTKPAPVAGPAQPGANMALSDMTISGVMNADGGMAGNIAMKVGEGTGNIKWSAERFKERAVPQSQTAVLTEGVSLTGNWNLTIVEAQVGMEAELTQTGSKITGVAKSEHLGTMKIEGTFVAGTLSFVSTGSVNGQDVRIEYTGKYKANGSFAGDLTSQMGAMTWTAERIKK